MKCLLIILLLSVNSAWAAMRCGNNLITEGDSTAKVLATCGKPYLVEQKEAYLSRKPYYYRPHGRRSGVIYYEEWTYNFGPQRFMQRLLIRDGRVQEIEDLEYGR